MKRMPLTVANNLFPNHPSCTMLRIRFTAYCRSGEATLEDAFFSQFPHDESKLRDLALLCFLNDVEFERQAPQQSTDQLLQLLEREAGRGAKQTGRLAKVLFYLQVNRDLDL